MIEGMEYGTGTTINSHIPISTRKTMGTLLPPTKNAASNILWFTVSDKKNDKKNES
jgi:hypothetical protein